MCLFRVAACAAGPRTIPLRHCRNQMSSCAARSSNPLARTGTAIIAAARMSASVACPPRQADSPQQRRGREHVHCQRRSEGFGKFTSADRSSAKSPIASPEIGPIVRSGTGENAMQSDTDHNERTPERLARAQQVMATTAMKPETRAQEAAGRQIAAGLTARAAGRPPRQPPSHRRSRMHEIAATNTP